MLVNCVPTGPQFTTGVKFKIVDSTGKYSIYFTSQT